jgi:hypothetical protein
MQLKFFEETKADIKRKKKIRKKLTLHKLSRPQLLYLQAIIEQIVSEYEGLLGYNIRPPKPPARSSSFNLL